MRRTFETISLAVLIGVVILRPLVAESYDSATSSLTAALGAVSDPTPVGTYVFDLLILLASGGWLIAVAIGRPTRYIRTGLGWGTALVALAVVVSCVFAGNQRLAVNASIDWLCYPILAITLAQLLRTRWSRRLFLAAVLASAVVQAVECLEQDLVGFEDTWAHYESIKEEFWARQGVDLGSGKVESFEARLRSGEAAGFMPHSNVTGSYLVLCGMAAFGLALARRKRAGTAAERWLAVFVVVGAAIIVAGAMATNSLGAKLAGVAGLGLWLLIYCFRSWIDAHRARALLIGWTCAAVGVLAVVGHGLYHDALPGWSLTFRWQYWKASSELIADHALTGVGRENFSRHYLRYKSIESPEEVANPHNLFVQAAADWGGLGLIGVMVMMVGASFAVAGCHRPWRSGKSAQVPLAEDNKPSRNRKGAGSPEPPEGHAVLPWVVVLALVVVVGRLPLLGTADPDFLYYVSVTTGICWLIAFAVFATGESRTPEPANSGDRLVTTGVGVGLFAFLVHDMINFALFVPGSATTFFALLGFCIAGRAEQEFPTIDRSWVRWRWLLSPLAAWVVVVVSIGLWPVVRASHNLELARQAGRELLPVPITAQLALGHFLNAAKADPIDPTPELERAEWLTAASQLPQVGARTLALAARAVSRAIDRDPHSLGPRRMQMRIFQEKAKITADPQDYLAAIQAARDALELYPRNPKGIAMLADRQLDAGGAMASEPLLQEAIQNYERALTLDNERLEWEELRRLRPKERQEIRSSIERAQELIGNQP